MRGEGIYRFVIEHKEETGEWARKFEVPLRLVYTSSES